MANLRAIGRGGRHLLVKVWNLPNSLVGLLVGGAGWLLGLAMGQRQRVRVGNNAIEFLDNPTMPLGAITLGNVIIYGKVASHPDLYDRFAAHERQHTYQGELLGPFYLPSNLLGGGLALLRQGSWHGSLNWNETGPRRRPPVPWPRRRG
jgi:hypothetical protein